MHLCAPCARELGRQYRSLYAGFPLGMGQLSSMGGSAAKEIPSEMSEEFRRRRKLSELEAKLQRAVEAEDYETAAALRDEMKQVQKAGENPSAHNTGRRIPVN